MRKLCTILSESFVAFAIIMAATATHVPYAGSQAASFAINVSPSNIIPGASVNLTAIGAWLDIGAQSSQRCPSGVCTYLLPPASMLSLPASCTGLSAAECYCGQIVSSLSSYPACNTISNSPISLNPANIPCYLSPSGPTVALGAGYDGYQSYYTPHTLPQNSLPYLVCSYYTPNGNPESESFYTLNAFNITPSSAGSGGLELGSSPSQFALGTAPLLALGASQYYESQLSVPNLCGPYGNCTIEFTNSSIGCVAPPPYNAPYNMQDCSWLNPASNVPCILSTYPNNGVNNLNGGGYSYTQPLNTAYLPNGNYLACAYDYLAPDLAGIDTANTGIISPFTAVTQVLCSGNSCVVAPYSVPTSTTSINAGFYVTLFLGGAQPIISNTLGSAICSVYLPINMLFLILAVTLMTIGGALYALSTVLPGAMQGTVRGYAIGLVTVGAVSTIISVVAIWAIAVGTSTAQANVVSVCNIF